MRGDLDLIRWPLKATSIDIHRETEINATKKGAVDLLDSENSFPRKEQLNGKMLPISLSDSLDARIQTPFVIAELINGRKNEVLSLVGLQRSLLNWRFAKSCQHFLGGQFGINSKMDCLNKFPRFAESLTD